MTYKQGQSLLIPMSTTTIKPSGGFNVADWCTVGAKQVSDAIDSSSPQCKAKPSLPTHITLINRALTKLSVCGLNGWLFLLYLHTSSLLEGCFTTCTVETSQKVRYQTQENIFFPPRQQDSQQRHGKMQTEIWPQMVCR